MRFVGAWIGLALLLLAGPAAFAQVISEAETAVDQFAQSRTAGDRDGALDVFADDAVITVQAGKSTQVFVGRDQVRAYLEAVVLPSHVLMRSTYHVDGPFVRWTERVEEPRGTIDAVVQATVQSGHIASLLFQQSEPFGDATSDAAALPQSREPPTLALALGLGILVMLVVGFFFRPRPRTATSQLTGRLVSALRLTRRER